MVDVVDIVDIGDIVGAAYTVDIVDVGRHGSRHCCDTK